MSPNVAPVSRDYDRFCRLTKPSAERPTPSNANDDGSGTVVGVSENWFVRKSRIPEVTVPESVRVRLVVGAKAMLSVSEEFDAESDLPFDSTSEI